jgi:hypothetical protein
MNHALQLCSLALNPQAPNPTATMVKLENGHMIAFGGLFCISVPEHVEVGACFSPRLAGTFFRKDRSAVTYTINKGKLTLREGKEKLTVPCVPPEEMVTLDVLSSSKPVNLLMNHFRSLTDVIDPQNNRKWAQGISFRKGLMEATNNSVIISAISGLSDDLVFNLPVDSAKALMRFKSPVVSIAVDNRAVKFTFSDGSSLTSLVLVEQMVDVSHLHKDNWTPLNLKDIEDFLKLECETITFKRGNATYTQEHSQGVIEGAVDAGITVSVSKEPLDRLLKISSDIRVSEDGNRLLAVSETCRGICSTIKI